MCIDSNKIKSFSRKTIIFTFFSIAIFSQSSCNDNNSKDGTHKDDRVGLFDKGLFSQDDFSAALKKAVLPLDTLDSTFRKVRVMNVAQAVRYVYMNNEYVPFWVKEKGVTDAAGKLISELDELRWDGLDPEKYHLSELKTKLEQLKGEKNAPLADVIGFDTTCTRSYLQASRDLLIGGLPPKRADSLWFHANDSSWSAPQNMVASLGAKDAYPALKDYRSEIPTYKLLQASLHHYDELAHDENFKQAKEHVSATTSDSIVSYIIEKELPGTAAENDTDNREKQLLLGFQYYYGLKLTGKKDSSTVAYLSRQPDSVKNLIEANMERLRWMPRKLEDTYVLVNIPMMEFMLRKDGLDAMRMRVVVGRPSRQTPSLSARMVNVVFNPSWGVPPTILKKDVLPGLTKSGAAYLSRKGLRAFDHSGNAVDAGTITESNYKRFVYKQAPGDRNSLGVIKFNLPNPWDIYLHDTPHKEDFPNRYRAKSSGCIRLQQPRLLAEYILDDLEGRGKFSQDEIDTIVQTHKTRYEILKNKIPVHIVYLTAFEDSTGQKIRFFDDVYNRDKKVYSLLVK